ncbi:carbohydrate ABC transporter permease [Gemmiger formicilis]|uniref:carbohydrate ABC transporter permease n=1 Tax=Gemmiger formicilis TaxID=745368 RepID=UPI001959339E|nr:carbohydrate ABC transporter permease [Gemmiger formicilis]MBM6915403.1 carbohydrate ABC transporter permease [Gemmiger formicilis]
MKHKFTVGRALTYVLMIAYLVLSIYPLLWLLFYSFKDNAEIFVTNPFGPPTVWRWENYAKAVSEFNIAAFFKNNVIVSVASIVIGIFCALLSTYVVARIRTRLTRSIRMLVMMGMFIPVQAIMTPLVVMVKNLHLSNSLWSLIIPYVALGFPFSVMVLYGFYVNLPMELEESACIEGANFFTTFFRIILPQVKSAIAVLVIYQFMSAWNEFSLALVLITKEELKTLPLGLSSFQGQFSTDWGATGASLVIASLPVLMLYLFFSEKVSDSMAFSGLKD